MFTEIIRNKRKTVYVFIYLIGITAITVIVHEAAHVLAALSLGVPFNEIKVMFFGINPGMKVPERFTSSSLAIYHYAGGLTAAVALLCVYLFYWLKNYRHKPSLFNWLLGAITITLFSMQLGQGYLEGRFHGAYMSGANSLFDSTDILLYIFVVFGWIIHFQIFPISKIKKWDSS